MKVISERISILKKDDLLSVVILPTTDRKKKFLLFVWLLAWTVCGLIVLVNYFKISETNAKLFIIVYLAFWAYFEFNIIRAFIWIRWGKEKLWMRNNILHYQREINGKGKIREYDMGLVSKLNLIELRRSSLSDTINQSFWVKAGERLEFYYSGTVIKLGMQINDEEARTIMREVNKLISG